EPGDGRPRRAGQANTDRRVGGALEAPSLPPDSVQEQGSGPGPEGNVCQHGVQRMPEPGPVQEISDPTSRLAADREYRSDGLLHPLPENVEHILSFDSLVADQTEMTRRYRHCTAPGGGSVGL